MDIIKLPTKFAKPNSPRCHWEKCKELADFRVSMISSMYFCNAHFVDAFFMFKIFMETNRELRGLCNNFVERKGKKDGAVKHP